MTIAPGTGTGLQWEEFSAFDRGFGQFLNRLASRKAEFSDDALQPVAFAGAALSHALRQGISSLDTAELDVLWSRANGGTQPPDWAGFFERLDWEGVTGPSSGAETTLSPLVYDLGRLYLRRMWEAETQLAHELQRRARQPALVWPPEELQRLVFLSPTGQATWADYALFTALTRKVSVITGGPGSGKTTLIGRLVEAIRALSPESRISLAAPTGKAAGRLTEAIRARLSQQQAGSLPEAMTLHRLLGARSNGKNFRFGPDQFLPADWIIVDESSMADLLLLRQLLVAAPPGASVVLLGDAHQLPSVDAGAVFQDICATLEPEISPAQAAAFAAGTGLQPPDAAGSEESDGAKIDVVVLRASYRFSGALKALADAINAGGADRALRLLRTNEESLGFFEIGHAKECRAALARQTAGFYRGIVDRFADHRDPATALSEMSAQRLLCAVRSGPLGVEAMNREISTLAFDQLKGSADWYPGKPVIITVNDYQLGLYNGDLGVVLPDPQSSRGRLRVYFPAGPAEGGWKALAPARLPTHETAYALTVHKSQGSEFEKVDLVLPTQESPVLSRALLYTAVTRSRESVAIWSAEETFRQAVLKPPAASSGMRARL